MNKVKKWLVFFQHLNNEIDTHDLPTTCIYSGRQRDDLP